MMESHHYGWWPSFIGELAKWAYWTPSRSYEEVLERLAKRDFGDAAAPMVMAAWSDWSEAIRHYRPTTEDQYGPFRVGPSYPLFFRKIVKMPEERHATAGGSIVETDYKPLDDSRQSPGIFRIEAELRDLEWMREKMDAGNERLEKALALTPEGKREEAFRMLVLGRFIACCVQTALHAKQWWKLKQSLFGEADKERAYLWLERMEELALREIANAEAAIPLVEADSRLGWEPSMEYMTDAARLRWKIDQVRSVLDHEFADYRSSLALTGD